MTTAPDHTLSADRAVAEAFVRARLAARAVPDYPGDLPQQLARAYAIQDAAIALYPDRVVGWKVGGVPPAQQPALGIHRLAGAIFAGNVWSTDEAPTPLPAIEGGFAAVEAEFIARIGADTDPAKTDWTIEEAADQIDAVFIGVELAGSPLSAINELGSAVVASDFGNNGGLVIGPELTDWRDRLDAIQVETVIDGVSVGRGGSTSLAGGALESVRFLLEHCARWGRPLTAGTLVSTGAVTGVHRVYAGSQSTCVFEGVGEIRCTVVKAAPQQSPG
ncbi:MULTISPECIES: 2-keto-4-pentenoate hydratase [unclassified Brevundimonas]|uniref:2-keto-4-pentenoate hydratase n=1 Tax=unclassified Brevundimonas TaxID=2622653 RepID=UPI003F93B2FB